MIIDNDYINFNFTPLSIWEFKNYFGKDMRISVLHVEKKFLTVKYIKYAFLDENNEILDYMKLDGYFPTATPETIKMWFINSSEINKLK